MALISKPPSVWVLKCSRNQWNNDLRQFNNKFMCHSCFWSPCSLLLWYIFTPTDAHAPPYYNMGVCVLQVICSTAHLTRLLVTWMGGVRVPRLLVSELLPLMHNIGFSVTTVRAPSARKLTWRDTCWNTKSSVESWLTATVMLVLSLISMWI